MPINIIIAEKYHKEISEIISGPDSCYNFGTVEQYYLLNWLLAELKSPSPEWKPYLDMLPENMSTFPQLFGQEAK